MPSSFWFIVSNSALFCGLVHISEVFFREKGVRFIAVSNGVDSTNNTSSEFAPFLNIMNEWYLRDCSRKITAVLRAKGKEGKPLTNNPPYGYMKDAEDKNCWVIDEEAAAVLTDRDGSRC